MTTIPPPPDPSGQMPIPAPLPEASYYVGPERRRGNIDVTMALDEVRRLSGSVVSLTTAVSQSQETQRDAERRFRSLLVTAAMVVVLLGTWVRLSDTWAADQVSDDVAERHELLVCLLDPAVVGTTTDKTTLCRLEVEGRR